MYTPTRNPYITSKRKEEIRSLSSGVLKRRRRGKMKRTFRGVLLCALVLSIQAYSKDFSFMDISWDDGLKAVFEKDAGE